MNKTKTASHELAINDIQAKYLYALVTVHIDHLTSKHKHTELSARDQAAHIVLGQIEEKLLEFVPEVV